MKDQESPAAGFRRNLVRYGGDMYPAIVERAQGTYVWDATGKRILDFTSGQMCATVGHNHPNIVAAIRKSCETALHLFSGMIPRSVVRLADAIAKIVPPPLRKSLFVNTGSESNEAAIKMAKLCTGGFEVVGLGGSWHGVTGNAGAVSFASDRKGYGPGMPGTFVLPEPNAYRCPIRHCRDRCDRTCMKVGFELYDMQSTGARAAVIAEPVISAGGVIVPPDGYFNALAEETRKRNMLLIFDEAQTAFGRLGHWFAASYLGVTPDLLTVSKTLGGGIPLAAVITTEAIEAPPSLLTRAIGGPELMATLQDRDREIDELVETYQAHYALACAAESEGQVETADRHRELAREALERAYRLVDGGAQ